MEFSSEIFGRKIIVRDINRFHRSSAGLCSCGEFCESVTGQSVPCNMPFEINNLLVIMLLRLTPYQHIIVIHASLTMDCE
ncbi:hypothetical protein C5167_030827 [Papaver somniferum]|nr:hypothetical protein C5167_030827 [Papaver somniferum]